MVPFFLSAKHGDFVLLRGDYISTVTETYGEWADLEIDLLTSLLDPDDIVIDVGANLGLVTVPLARAVPRGRVLAFEPQRILYYGLCGNIVLNACANVYASHAAVGDRDGWIEVPEFDFDRDTMRNYGATSLLDGHAGVPRSRTMIVRLDTAVPDDLPRPIRLIKVDAEGMERQVLQGAAKVVERDRPFLFLECNERARGGALLRLVQELGYAPYWFCTQAFSPTNHFGRADNLLGNGGDIAVLCYPPTEPRRHHGLLPAVDLEFLERPVWCSSQNTRWAR